MGALTTNKNGIGSCKTSRFLVNPLAIFLMPNENNEKRKAAKGGLIAPFVTQQGKEQSLHTKYNTAPRTQVHSSQLFPPKPSCAHDTQAVPHL